MFPNRLFVMLVVFYCINLISGSIFSWFYETYEKGIKQIEAEGRLPKPDVKPTEELLLNTRLESLTTEIVDNVDKRCPKNSAGELGGLCIDSAVADSQHSSHPSPSYETGLSSSTDYYAGSSPPSPGIDRVSSLKSDQAASASADHSEGDSLISSDTVQGILLNGKDIVPGKPSHGGDSETLLSEDAGKNITEGTERPTRGGVSLKIADHKLGPDQLVNDQEKGSDDAVKNATEDSLKNQSKESNSDDNNNLSQSSKLGDPSDGITLNDAATNLESNDESFHETSPFDTNGSPAVDDFEEEDEADGGYPHVPFEHFPSSVNIPSGSSLLSGEDYELLPQHDGESNVQDDCLGDNCPASIVSFELASADEKFLEEATSLLSASLSPLDMCQHRLVLSLKRRCQSLSEEELGKLSVNLLNCQSHAEGRVVYPCLQEMSLSQCTHLMDASTWNAYLLMSNRALAVCHGVRQQLFSAQARLSVDQLVRSAHLHTDIMLQLRTQQESLQEATEGTLTALWSGQERLQQEQDALQHQQQDLGTSLLQTALMVDQHKARLAAQHSSVASFSSFVMRRLASAQVQLSQQSAAHQSAHDAMLHSLHALQQRAAALHMASERNMRRLVQTQMQSLQRQQRLQVALLQLGASVQSLHSALHNSSAHLHSHMAWVTATVSHTGYHMEEVLTVLTHAGTVVIALVSAAVLKVPRPVRGGAVVLVLCNAGCAVVHRPVLHCGAVLAAVAVLYAGSLLQQKTAFLPALSSMSRKSMPAPAPQLRVASSYDYSSDDDADGTAATPPSLHRAPKFVSRTPASAHRYSGYDTANGCALRSPLIGGDFPSQTPIGGDSISSHLIGAAETRQPIIGGNHPSWLPFIGGDKPASVGEGNFGSLVGGKDECPPMKSQGRLDGSSLRSNTEAAPPSKLEQIQQLLAPSAASRGSTPTRRKTPTRGSTPIVEVLKESERHRSNSPTPSLNRSGRGKICGAVCRSGQACRNSPMVDSSFCRSHT